MRVEVCSLCKDIRHVHVLDDINLVLESGCVYGVQGKNGSGKTMLLRALSGLIRPTSGCVRIDGETLGVDRSFPDSVGLLIENPAFIDKYTGKKNLELIAGIRGQIGSLEIDESLRRVGLDPCDRRRYRKYSLGMKQRLGVACAIMESPSLVLLDEPINALDPRGVDCVETIVREEKERGALVIIACHDKEELTTLADEIITMAEGRVISLERVAA